jgi:aspartate/methionine/tyrosine aminotransferase
VKREHKSFGKCETSAKPRTTTGGNLVTDALCQDGKERVLLLDPYYWTDKAAAAVAGK